MLVGAGQECQEVFSPSNNDDGSVKLIVPEAVLGVLTQALKFAQPSIATVIEGAADSSSSALADASEYVMLCYVLLWTDITLTDFTSFFVCFHLSNHHSLYPSLILLSFYARAQIRVVRRCVTAHGRVGVGWQW